MSRCKVCEKPRSHQALLCLSSWSLIRYEFRTYPLSNPMCWGARCVSMCVDFSYCSMQKRQCCLHFGLQTHDVFWREMLIVGRIFLMFPVRGVTPIDCKNLFPWPLSWLNPRKISHSELGFPTNFHRPSKNNFDFSDFIPFLSHVWQSPHIKHPPETQFVTMGGILFFFWRMG